MRSRMQVGSLLLLVAALTLAGCTQPQPGNQNATTEKRSSNNMDLEAKIRRFAPTEITADTSKLSANDRQALDKIIEAARAMDAIFLRQVWSGNVELKKRLEADTSPAGQLRLHYFTINAGPWSRLDKNEPFIEGVPKEKPLIGGFYPDDMSKEEFESWQKSLPEAEQQK